MLISVVSKGAPFLLAFVDFRQSSSVVVVEVVAVKLLVPLVPPTVGVYSIVHHDKVAVVPMVQMGQLLPV